MSFNLAQESIFREIRPTMLHKLKEKHRVHNHGKHLYASIMEIDLTNQRNNKVHSNNKRKNR